MLPTESSFSDKAGGVVALAEVPLAEVAMAVERVEVVKVSMALSDKVEGVALADVDMVVGEIALLKVSMDAAMMTKRAATRASRLCLGSMMLAVVTY